MSSVANMIQLVSVDFKRGSKIYVNEKPIKFVRLSPYWIDKFPVTNEDYAHFINEGGYKRNNLWTDLGWNFINKTKSYQPRYWNDPCWNQSRQPVTGVSWWEAMAYARFVGKTLPTEAQWEFAAGGGKDTYPWGEISPNGNLANYAPGCEPLELKRSSTSVDQFVDGVSNSGCWDMAGNIGEWCIDNVSADYTWDFYGENPVYMTSESHDHIVRGGSGLHDEDTLRCASRDYYPPTLRDNIVGIRCVLNTFIEENYAKNNPIS